MLSLTDIVKAGESILGNTVKSVLNTAGTIYTTKDMKKTDTQFRKILKKKRSKNYFKNDYYVNGELFSEPNYVKGLTSAARLKAVYEIAKKYRLGNIKGEELLEETFDSKKLTSLLHEVERDLGMDKNEIIKNNKLNFYKTEDLLNSLKKEYRASKTPIFFESYMMGVQSGVKFLKKVYEEFKIIIANEACKLNLLDSFESEIGRVKSQSEKSRNVKKAKIYTKTRELHTQLTSLVKEEVEEGFQQMEEKFIDYVSTSEEKSKYYLESLIQNSKICSKPINESSWKNIKFKTFKKKVNKKIKINDEVLRAEMYNTLNEEQVPKWVSYYNKMKSLKQESINVAKTSDLKKLFKTEKLNYYAINKLESMGFLNKKKRGEYEIKFSKIKEDDIEKKKIKNINNNFQNLKNIINCS